MLEPLLFPFGLIPDFGFKLLVVVEVAIMDLDMTGLTLSLLLPLTAFIEEPVSGLEPLPPIDLGEPVDRCLGTAVLADPVTVVLAPRTPVADPRPLAEVGGVCLPTPDIFCVRG